MHHNKAIFQLKYLLRIANILRYFHDNVSYSLKQPSLFSHDLKLADDTPLYKIKSEASENNYRPVSILSNIFKVYKRCIYDHMQTYFDKILSKYQCGFRKVYNSQHCLIAFQCQ